MATPPDDPAADPRASRRVLLYVTGAPGDAIAEPHGTYVDWFARLFAAHDLAIEVFDATTGRLPDRLERLGAVVITGAPASVTAPEPWMEAAIELIRHAHRTALPVLGVCLGHQLVGAAFGGAVIRNPAGWQLCTSDVELTDRGADDPLFAGLPRRIAVNFSHEDIVSPETLSPANGASVLASNTRAAVAAIAAGPHVRGVQFHPEFSGLITRAILEHRRELLAAQAAEHANPAAHPDTLLAGVRDSPHGEQVFHNFLRHYVRDPA